MKRLFPHFKLLILFLGVIHSNIWSQSEPTTECDGKLLSGFISDGHEYLIKTKEVSKFDLVFYSDFIYRIRLCTERKDIKMRLTLIDEKGNVQYENVINYGFFRDFRFETLFHGQIIIKPLNVDGQSAQLLIGYKKI